MIVWSVTRDALHIADPNYPGHDDRLIYFSNGAFDPYSSGANWEDIQAGKGKDYETIMFLAKSTLISWENIAQRWQEVKDGSIGNDLFPGYQLLYRDEDTGDFKPLGENQVFTDAKVRFSSSGDGQVTTGISIYRDGERLPSDGDWKIDLVPGDNLLGFNVLAKVGDDWEYADFQYVNVVFSQELTLVETYHNPHSDSPDLKERYWVDGKGIKQGTYESFHKNGAVDRKGSYRNDLREGTWVSRWDNGNMASEGSYTAGSRQGVWKFYYEDGSIGSMGSFKDDKLDGLWESWRSDGVKEEDQRYKEGVKHGLWTTYHSLSTSDNLIKFLEGMYDNGEKTGTWTYWNNLGEVIQTEEY
jgi:antitoxin component YwqK of YwqJK toxin-antitoxin module